MLWAEASTPQNNLVHISPDQPVDWTISPDFWLHKLTSLLPPHGKVRISDSAHHLHSPPLIAIHSAIHSLNHGSPKGLTQAQWSQVS